MAGMASVGAARTSSDSGTGSSGSAAGWLAFGDSRAPREPPSSGRLVAAPGAESPPTAAAASVAK